GRQQISELIGYDRAELAGALNRLQELGLVKPIRISGQRYIYRRIAPEQENRQRALANLMRLADSRAVRLALIKQLQKTPDLSRRLRRTRFPVVAFGCSAGGLAALREILRFLPKDTGMAFVVVQHMLAGYASLLPEILSQATAMQVLQISDG